MRPKCCGQLPLRAVPARLNTPSFCGFSSPRPAGRLAARLTLARHKRCNAGPKLADTRKVR
jgi:hypothetical protein